MNRVVIIGRLTADPELQFTQSGTGYANVRVAVDRDKSKDGEKETDFIPVTVWGKSAENLAKYMSKGRQIAVEGRIQIDRVQGQGGKPDQWFTKVVANRVEFLGGGGGGGQQPQVGLAQQPTYQQVYGSTGQPIGQEVAFTDGDLPF